jgi:hypothetical protein
MSRTIFIIFSTCCVRCYTRRRMGKKVKVTRIVDVTELGRLGGAATAAGRTSKERSDAAREAVQARWAAYYAAHPEKVKTRRSGASRKKKVKK